MIYINVDQKNFSDLTGKSSLPVPEHLRLFWGTLEVLHLKLMSNGSALALSASDTFSLTLDNNFIHTDDLMASSADFEIVDAEAGLIDMTMNCTAAMFGGKIGTARSILAYLQIWRLAAGETIPAVVLQDTIYAYNSVQTVNGAPEPGNPEYYRADQVDAMIAGILDIVEPYDFFTDAETGETIIFSAAELGVDAEACDFEIIQVLETEKKTVTGDASIFRKWTSAGYVVTYIGGWPAGSWQLRAGKIKGDQGRDGEEYDRVAVPEIALTVQRRPNAYYITATAGTMTIDWSAVGALDKTIPVIITMPDPAVAFVLPAVDHWFDASGTKLESAPDISAPGEHHFTFKKYANGIIGFYLFNIEA